MPQSPAKATVEPNFIPADPDFIPASGSPPVQKKTLEERKASAYRSGAAGSWEPETIPEKIERKVEPYRANVRHLTSEAIWGGVGALKGAVDIIKSPFTDVKVTPEEKAAGMEQTDNPFRRFNQEVGRQTILPSMYAASWWKQQLSDPGARSNLIDKILDVGPDALAQAAGMAVAGKAMESAGATAKEYNPYGITTRGTEGIERATAKHGNAVADDTAIRGVLDEIADYGQFHSVPEYVKKIQKWFDVVDKAKTATVEGGKVEKPPDALTFKELRKMRVGLDDQIVWDPKEGKSSSVNRLVKKLRATMDKTEYKTVFNSGGASDLADYAQSKRWYARGMAYEKAGRAVGGAVGAGVGASVGHVVGKLAGHPLMGSYAGASAGGAAGVGAGKSVARAITHAGMPKDLPPLKAAMAEIQTEKAASVSAAKDFGKGGPEGGTPSGGVPKGEPPKSGPGGESEVEMILRRANVPDDVKAKVRAVMEKNAEMHRRAAAPKGDPDAPASEVFQRAKAEYEKKYGPSKQAAEMKAKQDEAIRKSDKEKFAKTSSGGEAARHTQAFATAKAKLGAKASLSEIMAEADRIERSGRGQSEPSARESSVHSFLDNALLKAKQEAVGQGILDDMSHRGESPIELNRKFWSDIFPKLNPEVQARFTNYLQKETSFKPGDTIGFTKDKAPIIAKDWQDIAENILDLSHKPEELEGSTRGLVSLMKIAEMLSQGKKIPGGGDLLGN